MAAQVQCPTQGGTLPDEPDNEILVVECCLAPTDDVQAAITQICSNADTVAKLAFHCHGEYADSHRVLVLSMRAPCVAAPVAEALLQHQLYIGRAGPSEEQLLPGVDGLTSPVWRAEIPVGVLKHPDLVTV